MGIGIHAKAETRCGLGGASNTIDCPLYVLEDNRSGPGWAWNTGQMVGW